MNRCETASEARPCCTACETTEVYPTRSLQVRATAAARPAERLRRGILRGMERLRALVHGTVLMVIIGWLLYIGQAILVPAVLGAVIVYIIVGLAHVQGRLPVIGTAASL